ncbi:MAG: carboxypeptidase-like regulatory domain-containing protein [Pyrinomonadaceae bacterium]
MALISASPFTLAHARQQDSRGSITGTVRDSTGAVVVDADVALVNAQQFVLSRTKTDVHGRFRFEGLLPGSYVVLITRHDFSRRGEPVRVMAGEAAELKILLEVIQLAE